MTSATRRHTAEPPLPEDADIFSRDARWFAHATGVDLPLTREGVGTEEPLSETDVASQLADEVAGEPRVPLPRGTCELLEGVSFPHGRVGVAVTDPLGHALVAGFGLQRREPNNPFDDHRVAPSVRGRFPVHVLVDDGARRRVFDPYRHGLTTLPDAVRDTGRREVVLAGRYTRLPPSYKWFRGTLVNLELGIGLRQLCLGMELFGVPGRVGLPGPGARAGLAAYGLTPSGEWTLPLTVELDPSPSPPSTGPGGTRSEVELPEDPVLTEVLTINRAQEESAPVEPATVTTTVPTASPEGAWTWAETMWRRTSGGMPRGMYGTGGRRRRVPAEVVHDAARWLSVPPPGDLLREVLAALRVTCVLQAVDGHADGVYRLREGAVEPHREDPTAATRMEEIYGYPANPASGCDVRHATALWFLTVRPREFVRRFGAGAFNTAQYAAGWAAQGVSLAAAAAGLYARPVKAFREHSAQSILGLEPDEMVVFSIITGTPRHTLPALDLRM
ncbi:hypothetical protein [Streptomyces sp. ST2-7A]|uniref:hypothetical protein n=1 Tax=Streptomyces sp. ST2-7A TaxID=2907214 RepID=UPI001F2DC87F|nr:hypothetical protein [Streptomyces sp. ST2-7A]MCE7080564.1 hypothetical protein [Streptomyces sp. ST2-7A]